MTPPAQFSAKPAPAEPRAARLERVHVLNIASKYPGCTVLAKINVKYAMNPIPIEGMIDRSSPIPSLHWAYDQGQHEQHSTRKCPSETRMTSSGRAMATNNCLHDGGPAPPVRARGMRNRSRPAVFEVGAAGLALFRCFSAHSYRKASGRSPPPFLNDVVEAGTSGSSPGR